MLLNVKRTIHRKLPIDARGHKEVEYILWITFDYGVSEVCGEYDEEEVDKVIRDNYYAGIPRIKAMVEGFMKCSFVSKVIVRDTLSNSELVVSK